MRILDEMGSYLATDFEIHLRRGLSVSRNCSNRKYSCAVAEIWEVHEEAAIVPKEYLEDLVPISARLYRDDDPVGSDRDDFDFAWVWRAWSCTTLFVFLAAAARARIITACLTVGHRDCVAVSIVTRPWRIWEALRKCGLGCPPMARQAAEQGKVSDGDSEAFRTEHDCIKGANANHPCETPLTSQRSNHASVGREGVS